MLITTRIIKGLQTIWLYRSTFIYNLTPNKIANIFGNRDAPINRKISEKPINRQIFN